MTHDALMNDVRRMLLEDLETMRNNRRLLGDDVPSKAERMVAEQLRVVDHCGGCVDCG
jgi:hypothetical protein